MKPFGFSPVWRVSALLLLTMGGSICWAQTFPRTLETIEVVQAGAREAIRFRFSHPYQGSPVEEHRMGGFSLSFTGTGSRVPRYGRAVKDGKLLESFEVVQNRYSTTASFNLLAAKGSLKGKLRYESRGNVLRVFLDEPAQPAAPVAAPGPERDLLGEMTGRIAGAGAPRPPGAAAGKPAAVPGAEAAVTAAAAGDLGKFGGVDWLPTLITLALSLTVMVAVLYGALYLYNRFFARRLGRGANSQAIRQLASFHLGPKQRIVVLDINGEYIACGITATQISFLTRLEGGRGGQKRAGGRPAEKASQPPGSRAAGQAAAGGAAQSDPVQQFAEALKEKVGSMKRLK